MVDALELDQDTGVFMADVPKTLLVSICRRVVRTSGALIATLLVIATTAQARDPDGKLVDFEKSGAWEIWCIDTRHRPRVVCDLNIVLRYKPHPDFRALIPRVFVDDDGSPWFLIEMERQTSVKRGFIRAGAQPAFSLSECGDPCTLEGDEARALVGLLSSADVAIFRIHDYLIQEFDVEIDLDGFRDGLQKLKEMQARYRS